MKNFIFLITVLLFSSCSQVEKKPKPAEKSIPDKESTLNKIPKDYPKELPSVKVFPGVPFHTAYVNKMNKKPGADKAASVFRNHSGKSIRLSENQIKSFLKFLNDPTSYGDYERACFDPGVGFIFYDGQGKVVAYLSLCMDCHNFRSMPPLDLDWIVPTTSGFTKEALKKMDNFFLDWKFIY